MPSFAGPSRTSLIAFAAVAALAISVDRVAAQSLCLMNRVTCIDGIDTNAPTYTRHCANSLMMFGDVHYDIPAALIELESQSIGPTGAHLTDEFTFHGPAPGTPITVHLRAEYHAEIGARLGSTEAGGFAWLLPFEDLPGDAVPLPVQFHPTPGSLAVYDGVLDLVLTRPAGTPIGLEVLANVFADNGNASRAWVTFEFLVPLGVSVTSCNGYVQDAPVPSIARSWGASKPSIADLASIGGAH